MNQMNAHVIFLFEVLSQRFGTIDRTVLASRTTESHLQVLKIPLDKPLYMMIYQRVHGVQERQYLAVRLQKVDDGLVQAREGLVLLVFAGVVRAAAVEDIPTAITGVVCRKAAFKRKGVDRY